MDRLVFTCIMGIAHLKACLKSSHVFFPCYGAEAMVPIEVTVPSARLALTSKISNPNDCIYVTEALEEKRQNAKGMMILPEKD